MDGRDGRDGAPDGEAPGELWERLGDEEGPDIDAEVEHHLDALVRELEARGMRPEEARAEALRRFGDPGRVVRGLRRRIRWGRAARRVAALPGGAAREVRGALRTLARSPGTTLAVLATLTVGLGAATAIAGVADALLLRPLPYPTADRIAFLWDDFLDEEPVPLSAGDVADLRDRLASVESLAPYTVDTGTLESEAGSERVPLGLVDWRLLPALGVRPALGRPFTAEDDAPGVARVLLLGHDLWQRRFGGAPDVVGRVVTISGLDFSVVGVLPADFRLPHEFLDAGLLSEGGRVRALAPLRVDWAAVDVTRRSNNNLFTVAALAPGAELDRLREELERAGREWVERGWYAAPRYRGTSARLLPEEVAAPARPVLAVLGGAVVLLLVLACANVAMLLLARADRRGREIAIRRMLGAGRGRLVAQLLTESATLGLLGGAGGAAVAAGALAGLRRWSPGVLPRLQESTVHGGVLLFAVAAALATGLAFGILPALSLSRETSARGGGRTATPGSGQRRLRAHLLAGQALLATLLAVGAGLMLRSVQALRSTDLGFEPSGLVTARITLPSSRHPGVEDLIRGVRAVTAAVDEAPGVEAVGAARILPLETEMLGWIVQAEGAPPVDPTTTSGEGWQVVTPGYLEALGVPLLRGRWPTPSDGPDGPPVALVNEAMAAKHWPGEDPLGRRFAMGPDAPWITVVGLVGDLRHDGITREAEPEFYVPHAQFAATGTGWTPRTVSLVARVPDPDRFLEPVRRALLAADPSLAVSDLRPMEDVVGDAMAEERIVARVLQAFALAATLLAALGVYGVVAVLVARRRREMGIRLALGAAPGGVRRLVLGDGLRPVLAGTLAGLACAVFAAEGLGGLLHGVGSFDPLTYGVVAAAMAGAGALAAWVPARRATAADPVEVLRAE